MEKENVLPFSRDEINPDLGTDPEWRRDLFNRLDGEERVFEEILRGYYLFIARIASRVNDYSSLPMPPEEKICVGMFELWKAVKWISEREIPENRVNGVIYGFIFKGIIREVNYGLNERTPRLKTVSYEDMRPEEDDRSFLETFDQRLSLSEIASLVVEQISILQFLEAVARAYRSRNGHSQGERNVEIFVRRFVNRYFYRREERDGYGDKEIAKKYGLRRQRIQQIYDEVLKIALPDFEVKQHLAEMLGVTLEEVEEKI